MGCGEIRGGNVGPATSGPLVVPCRTVLFVYAVQSGPEGVDGLAVRLPETGEGLVQAFRREESPEASALPRLRGLDPNATYTLTNWASQAPRR